MKEPKLDFGVEIIGKVESPLSWPSGLAISKEGRIFISFPRHSDNHNYYSIGELINGKPVPLTDAAWNYPQPENHDYTQWLVSPHGITIDENGLLWVIDDGKRAGIAGIPFGAAKAVAIDLNTLQIEYNIPVPANILTDQMHCNDLRVDLKCGQAGTVFATNSGFGPHYSLLVMDIQNQTVRELFKNQNVVSPEVGFVTFVEGFPKVFQQPPTFPVGGADGIALDQMARKLYWGALSGRALYSALTADLSNHSISEAQLLNLVKNEGQRPASDGMDCDENGNLYIGAFEQLSIVKRQNSPNIQYSLLGRNFQLLGWPDSVCYHRQYVYITLCQANRQPAFNQGVDLRTYPYYIVRTRTNT